MGSEISQGSHIVKHSSVHCVVINTEHAKNRRWAGFDRATGLMNLERRDEV